MKFDTEIPIGREEQAVSAPFAGPPEIVQLAQLAEDLRYDAVWGTAYSAPKSEAGLDWYELVWYDLLIVLSYAAASTERIRLGAGASFLPYRNPITLAKQVATLDQVSKGRLMLGLGMGGYREAEVSQEARESYNSFVDDKAEALMLLLSHDHVEVSLHTEELRLDGVNLHPKPAQRPFPVYCPGKSLHNLRRIARLGLHCTIQGSRVDKTLADLKRLLAEYGRDASYIDVIAEGELCIAETHDKAVEKFVSSRLGRSFKREDVARHIANNWIGTPDEIAEKIRKIEAQGITHFLAIHVAGDSLDERAEQMQLFAAEVASRWR